jgi:hypothetical protein
VLNVMPPSTLASAKRFATIPYMALEVDAAVLDLLQASPDVTSIQEDVADRPHLAESTPLVEATTVWSRGVTGSGWAVAVLDTGVEQPFLRRRLPKRVIRRREQSIASACPAACAEYRSGPAVRATWRPPIAGTALMCRHAAGTTRRSRAWRRGGR